MICHVPCESPHHRYVFVLATHEKFRLFESNSTIDQPPSRGQRVDALAERHQWMPPKQGRHHPRLLTTMKIEVMIFGFGPLEGA
jgi:hypothetical protein